MKNQDAIKSLIEKIKQFVETHSDPEEDILGEDGKKLFQQVLSQM